MIKKYLLTASLMLTVGVMSVALLQSRPGMKSDEEIKEQFRCNRVTLEILATDVYCQDPELYRKHLKDNNVIGPRDYYRNQ